MGIPPLVTLLIVGAIGVAIGYYLRYLHAMSTNATIELATKERLLEAEEKALKLVEKAETKAEKIETEKKAAFKEIEEKHNKTEARLIKKEELLDQRQIDIDSEVEALRIKADTIKDLNKKLKTKEESIDTKLETVAGLTQEDAHAQVVQKMEQTHEEDLVARIQKLNRMGEEQFDDKAREILTTAIHRIGNTMHTDVMTASLELPSDDLKGKIIGKEGRNVRAFERATGVDVMIDETPGHITLSSFNPVRREIARVAMKKLFSDGRIQPAKIEEVVEKARKEVAKVVCQMGEKAAYEAGVTDLHPEIIKIMGRLHFRTSYGQNVLWHSVEMAQIAAIIANEIGADEYIARAGAFVHDIGKTVSQEVSGTHVELGRRILQKYDADERIILAMQAHHEEYPFETPESIIVQVADAISGGRPGARRDSIENYIKRLEELEQIANNMPGVEKAYAIQAGREVRVMVNAAQIDDLTAHNMARSIATEIEERLRYPGEIKVNVIREMRAIEFAR
ncbi:MAG: ribonuclease Y [Candidatus Pacebacteria bacterium]|nr:ribonuclease Y [Candidatus Paceibacterota bacterium]